MNVALRKAIVDEWQRQVLENSADKVTVKSISEACGISRQTFYYHFDDVEGVIRCAMEGGGMRTVRECRKVSDIQEGIRVFLSDFILYFPVAKSMKNSKYRDTYEGLVTENNRRVIETLIGKVYRRNPEADDYLERLVDFLACGLTQEIMEHCIDGAIDIEFLGQLIEKVINTFLAE